MSFTLEYESGSINLADIRFMYSFFRTGIFQRFTFEQIVVDFFPIFIFA